MSKEQTIQILLERSKSDINYAIELFNAGSEKTAKEILRNTVEVLDVILSDLKGELK